MHLLMEPVACKGHGAGCLSVWHYMCQSESELIYYSLLAVMEGKLIELNFVYKACLDR